MPKKKEKVVIAKPITLETETNKPDKIDMDRNLEFCMKKIPISPARIERIKDALRVWFDEHPEAKTISEFYYSLGISFKSYYRLLERDPELRELHDMTLHRIGDKLWGRSVDNKANWNAVRFRIHQFGAEYKEAKEFDANLAKKEDQVQQGPQFIIVKDFEDSSLVPRKKENS